MNSVWVKNILKDLKRFPYVGICAPRSWPSLYHLLNLQWPQLVNYQVYNYEGFYVQRQPPASKISPLLSTLNHYWSDKDGGLGVLNYFNTSFRTFIKSLHLTSVTTVWGSTITILIRQMWKVRHRIFHYARSTTGKWQKMKEGHEE